jgi:hypothetical protein
MLHCLQCTRAARQCLPGVLHLPVDAAQCRLQQAMAHVNLRLQAILLVGVRVGAQGENVLAGPTGRQAQRQTACQVEHICEMPECIWIMIPCGIVTDQLVVSLLHA